MQIYKCTSYQIILFQFLCEYLDGAGDENICYIHPIGGFLLYKYIFFRFLLERYRLRARVFPLILYIFLFSYIYLTVLSFNNI